jgi:hypothetical protein
MDLQQLKNSIPNINETLFEQAFINFRKYNLMKLHYQNNDGALVSINHSAPKYETIKNRKDGSPLEMTETFILNYFETMEVIK